ncbi:MAG TPA: hypothetical protein VFK32_02115, partial [Tepidiformaceae bacterium]|nr:hypothetical protein [Tepidiformaceae bacterium]
FAGACSDEEPGGLTAGASPSGTAARTQAALPTAAPSVATGIPRVRATFDVVITGYTAVGDTPRTTPATVYKPEEQFTINAVLFVEPTLPAPQGNVFNGPNDREFALFTGPASAEAVAGSIWIASNTILLEEFGVAEVDGAFDAMDVAFVNAYDAENRVDVEPDASFAILPGSESAVVNTFTWRSGNGESILVVSGGLKLYFAPDGQSVTGEVYVIGHGKTVEATYLMDGTITGKRRS